MISARVPLGDIADFINGVAFKPTDWEESGKRILRIQNLTDPAKPFNRTNREVAKKYEVAPGDLLVSWSATLGVFVWEGPDTALVNQHIFRVEPDAARIDSNYLRHMLADALIEMERHLHGATMKHVNRREFLATTIPLPPLAEQKRIAGILDAADALRAKRRESLAQLDTLLQSTFLDMFGDPVTNPMGWEGCSLSHHGSFKNGLNFRKGEAGNDIFCIGVGDFQSRTKIAGTDSLTTISLSKLPSPEYYVKHGDLLLVRSNGNKALVGRCVAVYPAGSPVTFSGFCIRYRVESGDLLPVYLTHLFRIPTFRTSLLRGGQGANIQNINQKTLSAMSIPLPPLDLQRRFAAIVDSVEQQKARHRAHLEELDTLFGSLQSSAFQGDL